MGKNAKQGFDVNWGDSDEVFTKAQSYLKKLPKTENRSMLKIWESQTMALVIGQK